MEEDLANAVKNAPTNRHSVYVENRQVIIQGVPIGETITIYNLQGIPIHKQQAYADKISVHLPIHGMYIVMIGLQSTKVMK